MAKILVVEDETHLWKYVEFKLARSGHQPFRASDGEEAVRLIRSERPDLVLLDIMIPAMDGIQVFKTIKQDKDLQSIPFIILSSKALDGDVIKGLEMGADDYITKPFNPDELLLRIGMILKRKKE